MRQDIWIFLLILFFAGLFGKAIGYPLVTMLVAAVGIIAWNSYRINQLCRWLDNPKNVSFPDTSGQFKGLYRLINKRKIKHKKRKRKLSNHLKQFRKAASALPDAIVLVDHFGKISWANANAADVFGIDWPNDKNVKFVDLISEPNIEKLFNDLPKNKSKERNSEREIEYNSKHKPEITISVRVTRYSKKQNMVIGRDISRLLKINQIQRDFVANVSHELKTPLTVLKGYLDIIHAKDNLPAELENVISQMQNQNERMELLVHDLLYLAKLENPQQQSPHKPVDITNMVNSVIETTEKKLSQKQLKLELDIDYDLKVLGNHYELHTAFSNLIYNAVNYTPQNGVINVSWKKSGDGVNFSVRDNGEGISSKHIPRLTQRFYRIDNDRSRDGGGTGLGLAIVKHVLQHHNAKLQIKSTVGIGSEFTCIFPITQVLQVKQEKRAQS